jgi:phenylalanyl-tRNA synthetase beta chain
MPSVILNKKVVEDFVYNKTSKKLSETDFKDRISMLGTDLESIHNNEIQVEIFPNRPDMLSEQGFARALSSFIGEKTGLIEFNTKPSGEKIIIKKSVLNIRPYTACAIVKGLNFNDERIREVIQIQEKLHVTYGRNRKKCAIGIYPMEKIKFPITFFAEEPKKVKFLPLESPGNREMDGLQILSAHPAGRDYGHLLKGLDKFPFFKDANDNILSMPPIINSHNTGRISENTTDVFVECSGFDYNVLAKCLNMVVTSLADMGGSIETLELEYEIFNGKPQKIVSPNLAPEKINLDLNYLNSRLGLDLKEKECIKLLEKMGYGYDNKSKKVLIPSYRADVLHMIDLVEDVAIAYGFENFEEIIPKVATIGEEEPLAILERQIAELLVGLKINEVYTYAISNDKVMSKNMTLTSNEEINKKNENNQLTYNPIILANSLSEDFNCIRCSMISSLIDVLSHNKHNDYPQHLFDIGTVFKKSSKTDTGVLEERFLSVVLCEDKIDFTRIKQILDYILNNLDLTYELEESNIQKSESFIQGRVGIIKIKGKELGIIGEIHPKILYNFELDYPVSALELNLTELLKLI